MNTENVSARLKTEHERLGSWEAVALQYSDETFKTHKPWVWALATKGIVPANVEACYRLGLRKRPQPKAAQPSALDLAYSRMIDETRRALNWKKGRA